MAGVFGEAGQGSCINADRVAVQLKAMMHMPCLPSPCKALRSSNSSTFSHLVHGLSGGAKATGRGWGGSGAWSFCSSLGKVILYCCLVHSRRVTEMKVSGSMPSCCISILPVLMLCAVASTVMQ